MKNALIVAGVLVLFVGVALAADLPTGGTSTQPAAAKSSVKVQPAICTGEAGSESAPVNSVEWAIASGMQETAAGAAAIPACPTVVSCADACSGGTPCVKSGPVTDTDTGQAACSIGGRVVRCLKGKTIHILSQPCSRCPCCTAKPYPCFCPIECGGSQSFECR